MRALTCVADADEEITSASPPSFHDAFLDGLQRHFDRWKTQLAPLPANNATAEDAAAQRRSLQQFLARFFPAYLDDSLLDALCVLLLHARQAAEGTATTTSAAVSNDGGRVGLEALTFAMLKEALQRHIRARLLPKDPFPLEEPLVIDVHANRRLDEEIELPRLNTTSKRTSLTSSVGKARPAPVLSPQSTTSGRTMTERASRHSLGALSDSSSTGDVNNANVLHEFTAEVVKKSQNWLGRWHTRYLFVRWNELEVCKKNLSFRQGLASSFTPSSSSGNTTTRESNDSVGSSVASPRGRTPAPTAKSKRYPLQSILSLQIIHLNESDPSKKQAINLHFKQTTSNGGTLTKSLILGAETPDKVKTVLSKIATFCLFHGLATRQSPQQLRKYVDAGAKLDMFCVVPNYIVPFPLAPLHLAFLEDEKQTLEVFKMLLTAGADPRVLFHWTFASQVLFSSAYGAANEAQGRKLVDECLQTVFFPYGVIADDDHRWNLLMYFCFYGNLESTKRLMTTFSRLSRIDCLRYLDHANAVGDTALHIAIKASTRQSHTVSEDIALFLIDVATSGTANGQTDTSVVAPPLSARRSSANSLYVDSQLIHFCDAHGDSVLHLALKAQMWRVVTKLIDLRATDPTSCDSFGNNALHLAIKVGTPTLPLARIVHAYQPPRVSAIASVQAERSQLITTLGYQTRDRTGNDTPLTLAIKFREEDVVELLVKCGADVHTRDCDWNAYSVPGTDALMGRVGPHDSPLHVSIKSGLDRAALCLVRNGADLSATDSNGASPLMLALRHGMYTLAHAIAERLAERTLDSDQHTRLWSDEETGNTATLLALKAGQLELAALLVDLVPLQMHAAHAFTRETLLHLLVKNICWMELSKHKHLDDRHSMASVDSDGITVRPKRTRLKSRSDGDLQQLRPLSLLPDPSGDGAATGNETAGLSSSEFDRFEFYKTAATSMVRGILMRTSNAAIAVASSKNILQQSQAHGRSSFHLPTEPSLVITDHNAESYTPLHVAAAGGEATYEVTKLLLAFIFERTKLSTVPMIQILARTTGSNAETPLHAALASNSSANALAILFCLQALSGKCEILEDFKPLENADPTVIVEVETLCEEIYNGATSLHGNTPLHLACRWPLNAQMLGVTELLFLEEAYGGAWNVDGLAPLHIGLTNRCDDRLVRLFYRYHQDLNIWSEGVPARRSNSLASAPRPEADRESMESCDALLEGVPRTPLMTAVEVENVEAFKELVRCGAQVKALTPRTHFSLVHFAVRKKVKSVKLIEELLKLKKLTEVRAVDAGGMSTSEAVEKLQQMLPGAEATRSENKQRSTPALVLGSKSGADSKPKGAATANSPATRSHDDCAAVSRYEALRHEQVGVLPIKLKQFELDIPDGSAIDPGNSTTQLSPSHAISISYTPSPTRSSPAQRPYRGFATGESTRLELVENRDSFMLSNSPPLRPSLSDTEPKLSPVNRPGNRDRDRKGSGRYLRSLPKPPGLPDPALEFLREEEKATLTLVAHEAKQEAKEWLKKRIGQRKLLSDARSLLQTSQQQPQPQHRRTNSGTLKVEMIPVADLTSSTTSPVEEDEKLLEKFKQLASKRFIDKHVAEAVAEAQMEIEREKQTIFQETGVYPGATARHERSRSSNVSMTLSMLGRGGNSSSFVFPGRGDNNTTIVSEDSIGPVSVWWSERGTGGSTFYDDNFTWLSSVRANGTTLSDTWLSTAPRGTALETGMRHSVIVEGNSSFASSDAGTEGRQRMGTELGDMSAHEWSEQPYANPLERESFAHIIEERKTLA
ncbi:TPA: hypothetical protein N0F65_008463 [Lagenidium giganteum]|uniref:Ankyrin repeat protein n=1 Tax=Lagenidium giganteum TaxID=4803 RepID=A0AAV2YFS1_9STRA|nr:TPA: hypothetical protein N0F65_008463 [Lagenidium giganteum]